MACHYDKHQNNTRHDANIIYAQNIITFFNIEHITEGSSNTFITTKKNFTLPSSRVWMSTPIIDLSK